MTPPPPRHFQYPVPPCVYKESRAHMQADSSGSTATRKTVVVWHNNTAVEKQYKNAKLSAKHTKTQECTRKKVKKKLDIGSNWVYYKLASNEGRSLRTGRSPHNRQLGQLSLQFLTTKKSRRDKSGKIYF